jgi:hypothetical protein
MLGFGILSCDILVEKLPKNRGNSWGSCTTQQQHSMLTNHLLFPNLSGVALLALLPALGWLESLPSLGIDIHVIYST